MTRFALCLTVILGLPLAAAAEEWACTFGGNWQTDDGATAAALTWKLSFDLTPQGWKIQGRDTDGYGDSKLVGTCDATTCSFAQTYVSGSASGQGFTWSGAVNDQRIDDSHGILDMKGTWIAQDGSSKGSWTAQAKCARKAPVANHDGCGRDGQLCVCSNSAKAGQCGAGPHKTGLYCQCDAPATHHDGCGQRAQACQCSNTGQAGKCETGPHKEGLYCRCD